jgi:hypothetical protein
LALLCVLAIDSTDVWRRALGYLGLILIVWACAIFVQRTLSRWRGKTAKRKIGFYPTGASMGNALQVLQAFVNPEVLHVIEERLEEPEEEDDETGPKDPRAHLMRQARRIRNGEGVERLTALLPPSDGGD